MKNWRVADKNLGEILIYSETDIGKSEEYAVKSLAMLQLVCMNSKEKEHFTEFLKIILEAIDKANKLYKNEEIKSECDAAELFR